MRMKMYKKDGNLFYENIPSIATLMSILPFGYERKYVLKITQSNTLCASLTRK